MIAIHSGKNGFPPRWISYCEKNGIPHKTVNCHSNDILAQLSECSGLLWHHSQNNPADLLMAKELLFTLEHSGFSVFPDFKTAWHFDDKLAQKYLFESLDIPHARMYAFYNKKEALEWLCQITYPKVFKLRGGAGSANVQLVKTIKEARSLIKKSFGNGFENFDRLSTLKERWRKFKLGKTDYFDLIKGIYRLLNPPEFSKVLGRERGYVLFQDYIPNNNYDIRVIVIGNKAFAIKRMVRENDFRASGSGNIRYEKDNFPDSLIKLSFEINKRIQSQSLAIDFIFDGGEPLVVEISYGFTTEVYDPCVGYWDDKLNWYPGKFDPYGWMVENLLKL